MNYCMHFQELFAFSLVCLKPNRILLKKIMMFCNFEANIVFQYEICRHHLVIALVAPFLLQMEAIMKYQTAR